MFVGCIKIISKTSKAITSFSKPGKSHADATRGSDRARPVQNDQLSETNENKLECLVVESQDLDLKEEIDISLNIMSTVVEDSAAFGIDSNLEHRDTLRDAFQEKKITSTKHAFKIAPTSKIAHRNDKSLAEKCFCCSHEIEDNDHVMIYPATDRRLWRNKLHRKLRTWLSNPTIQSDPVLIDILWDGLSRFFFNRPEPLEVSSYPADYAILINSQKKIGWSNTIWGHFIVKWASLQQRYLHRTNRGSDICCGRNWTDSAGQLLVGQWFDLWDIRNLAQHGVDKAEQVSRQKEIMETATTHLYELQTQVLPRDRQWFSSLVAEHLRPKPNLTPHYNWVTLNSSLIKASVKAASLLNVNNVNTITSWLRRVPARLDS